MQFAEVLRKLDKPLHRAEEFQLAEPNADVPVIAEAKVVAALALLLVDIDSLVADLTNGDFGFIKVPEVLWIAAVKLLDFFVQRLVNRHLLLLLCSVYLIDLEDVVLALA